MKYAAECNYMQFGEEDMIEVTQRSTNILKWNFGYGEFILERKGEEKAVIRRNEK